MSDFSTIAISFTNELQDHLEAQRVLDKKGLLAKLDKVGAILLFGFDVVCSDKCISRFTRPEDRSLVAY